MQHNVKSTNEETAPRILVIVGPTASGKTKVSILCAEKLNAEIVSADSRQVYMLMNIGTAKPTHEEKKNIPHHFVDELPPEKIYSAGAFGKDARERIRQILSRGKQVIVTGGSGLYIRSIVDGIFEGPSSDAEIRKMLEDRLKHCGHANIFDELRQIDPITAQTLQSTNRHRLIRALEIYYITGVPMSQLHQTHKPEIEYVSVQVGIEWNRKVLYQRIDARVDAMIQNRFVDEVRGLMNRGLNETDPAMNTVGYKEAFTYLRGECSLDEMITLMKQHTRNFAKRQLTWFRKDKRIRWFEVQDEETLISASERIAAYFSYYHSQ